MAEKKNTKKSTQKKKTTARTSAVKKKTNTQKKSPVKKSAPVMDTPADDILNLFGDEEVIKEDKAGEMPAQEDQTETMDAAFSKAEKRSSRSQKKQSMKEHYCGSKPRANVGRFFLGLILIGIGLLYLLQTTGWIDSMHLSINVWQLWPLIVVFIGLSCLSGRSWFSQVISVVITLAVVVFVGMIITFGGMMGKTIEEQALSVPVEAKAKTAEISLSTGAADLTISGGEQEALLSGTVRSNTGELETTSTISGEKQSVVLDSDIDGLDLFHAVNTIDMLLHSDLPLALNIDSGASKVQLDLRDVQTESVNIDSGASSVMVQMGDNVTQSVLNIDSGASDIDITLPETVGAKLMMDSGLSHLSITDFEKISEGVYESKNYDTAEKHIDITIDAGASDISIAWVNPTNEDITGSTDKETMMTNDTFVNNENFELRTEDRQAVLYDADGEPTGLAITTTLDDDSTVPVVAAISSDETQVAFNYWDSTTEEMRIAVSDLSGENSQDVVVANADGPTGSIVLSSLEWVEEDTALQYTQVSFECSVYCQDATEFTTNEQTYQVDIATGEVVEVEADEAEEEETEE